MSKAVEITYTAEPTAARMHASDAFVRGLRGPVGTGKSVACINEVVARACRQEPDAQGIRPTRWAMIRNTYPELKTTTIKTFQDWVPESVCSLRYGAPIDGVLRLPLADGTQVEAEFLFIALDRPAHVRKLLSLELTGAFVNEAREIPLTIIEGVSMRVGRFPPKKRVQLTWSGVIMDTNSPDDDHWWYGMFEDDADMDDEQLKEFLREMAELGVEYEQFVQPPALLRKEESGRVTYEPNPKAENVQHQQLGYLYWQRMIAKKTEQWIKVYVLGGYGSVQDGKPIYPEYNDAVHLRRDNYRPPSGSQIILGWDYGLTPACVFMQITPRGTLEVFDELVATRAGIRQFTEQVSLYLAANYSGIKIGDEYGDPSGGAARDTDEVSCFQIQRELGHPVRPGAMTLTDRLEGVRFFLTRLVDAEPGLRLSPQCKVLRKGFNGGYRFRRMQVSYDERYEEKPDKNAYSHPQDGLNHAVGRMYREFFGEVRTSKPRSTWRRGNARATARVA